MNNFYDLCDLISSEWEKLKDTFPKEMRQKEIAFEFGKHISKMPGAENMVKKYKNAYWSQIFNIAMGGMNKNIFTSEGKRKKYKTIVTSRKRELLTYAVIYEGDPGYAKARFKLP